MKIRIAKRPTTSGPSQRDTATLLPTLIAMITACRITSATAAPVIFPRKRDNKRARYPDSGGRAALAPASLALGERDSSGNEKELSSITRQSLQMRRVGARRYRQPGGCAPQNTHTTS